MSDTKKLTVEVTSEVHAQIRVAAALEKMSMSRWVVKTLEEQAKIRSDPFGALYAD